MESSLEGYGALPAFGLINRSKSETQGQVESARRSNSRALGSPFSGLTGHARILLRVATIYLISETVLIEKRGSAWHKITNILLFF